MLFKRAAVFGEGLTALTQELINNFERTDELRKVSTKGFECELRTSCRCNNAKSDSGVKTLKASSETVHKSGAIAERSIPMVVKATSLKFLIKCNAVEVCANITGSRPESKSMRA